MECLQANKAIYKIEKILGAGLTGQVYKAFREDDKGWSQQVVALKIIHSKKQVQVLKKEFENLTKVHSKNCVKVHAWENLNRGPALVLEYIEGVTLQQLIKASALDEELIFEVISQCFLGLKSLHEVKVFHGDLNLKNIMINTDGVVKLIDFGFQGGDSHYLTPEFSSPERLKGEAPTSQSDLFSLLQIEKFLCGEKEQSSEDFFNRDHRSRAGRRRSLSFLVKNAILLNNKVETICLNKSPRNLTLGWMVRNGLKFTVVGTVFFSVLLSSLLLCKDPEYYDFNLRSSDWFEIGINQLPFQHGPIDNKTLRKGVYKIVFKSPKGVRQTQLSFPSQLKVWKKENINTP